MFEKVNPEHPDKIADRIAGAIVDLAYTKNKTPKIAVEVLIGHGKCSIIAETSETFNIGEIEDIVLRIAGIKEIDYKEVKQDKHLADNQAKEIRCGDNGIFKGTPTTTEQYTLIGIAKEIFKNYNTDGKYIIDNKKLIICQSFADSEDLKKHYKAVVNPLGNWTGGINVDTGATNRKLGSDMGDAVTGGGLHGKDLSKADVSVNIFCYLLANKINKEVKCCCAIGDKKIFIYNKWYSYKTIVKTAEKYINKLGGFEKLAEWGIIC